MNNQTIQDRLDTVQPFASKMCCARAATVVNVDISDDGETA